MKNKNFDNDSIFKICICLLFILIGGTMLYFGITKGIEKNYELEEKYFITKGTVGNIRGEKLGTDSKGNPIYVDYATIHYTVENKKYSIEASGFYGKTPSINSDLKLKYEKINPQKASIYKTSEEIIYDFLILLGYMFTIFPLIILLSQFFDGKKYYYKISQLLIGLAFFGFGYLFLKFMSVNMFEYSFFNAMNVVGIGIFIPFIFMIFGILAIITFIIKDDKINIE